MCLTVAGMVQLYEQMAMAGETGDPSVLAHGVQSALMFTLLGLLVGGVGGALLLAALVVHLVTMDRRPPIPPQPVSSLPQGPSAR